MDKVLTWFIRLWVALALGINAIAIAGMFMANGFWGGLAQMREIFSPFNIINYIAEILLLSPALGAYWWLERRKAARLKSD
ncbi:hypothetical protein [Oricola indica]|uniref:hypothetical protein n=1 Tax=Oricola indica TaxID=2872591 RepID=UPI003CCB7EA6